MYDREAAPMKIPQWMPDQHLKNGNTWWHANVDLGNLIGLYSEVKNYKQFTTAREGKLVFHKDEPLEWLIIAKWSIIKIYAYKQHQRTQKVL